MASVVDSKNLTPMLRQYVEIKGQYPDAVLLYRMGDFYELFFEDAERAAPILDVVLTARQKGTPSEAPMCGVPHHAVESYIGKLLDAGLKVAVCDQVEDPAEAKGLVRREVTRVVTPGTVSEPELLEGSESSLLASLIWHGQQGAGAFLDVSTGELFVRRWSEASQALTDLELWRPREVLYAGSDLPESIEAWLPRVACRTDVSDELASPARATSRLEGLFGVASLRGFGLEAGEPAVVAADAVIEYARTATRQDLLHITGLVVHEPQGVVVLDEATLRNLEVFRNLRDQTKSNTLYATLDKTVTAAGARLLRHWLAQPLRDLDAISRRADAVQVLVESVTMRDRVRERLAHVGDLERLLARAVLGTLTPREAASVRDSLEATAALLTCLEASASSLLEETRRVDPVNDLLAELEATLEEEPAAKLKDGGVIRSGVDAELDRCRSLAHDGKKHLMAMEASERQATGIPTLKIRFNRVFGYTLEVTKAHQARVPEHYIRKQTLANAERYLTPELKALEESILGAEEALQRREEKLFSELRRAVVARAPRLRLLAQALAQLDVVATLAEVAVLNDYCRPEVKAAGAINIGEGRHPVVEKSTPTPFVPNDLELHPEAEQIVLLTGPNMGGKSTYLRQVALVVLMAQVGSFVPARRAEVSMVDRIFTRVGASDDLARGESTFMVEMIETANILRHAGSRSLVVLDEVGRGTATFDGLSLAWAIVEHLHEKNRCMTLFATHYHELTELAASLPRVRNRTMAVREWQDKIVFLHRVAAGSADKSYGIQVARLAGLPTSVLERASEILSNLERQEYDFTGKPRLGRGSGSPDNPGADQLRLFCSHEEVVADLLREVDLERLTPLAALNLLASLKERLGS